MLWWQRSHTCRKQSKNTHEIISFKSETVVFCWQCLFVRFFPFSNLPQCCWHNRVFVMMCWQGYYPIRLTLLIDRMIVVNRSVFGLCQLLIAPIVALNSAIIRKREREREWKRKNVLNGFLVETAKKCWNIVVLMMESALFPCMYARCAGHMSCTSVHHPIFRQS